MSSVLQDLDRQAHERAKKKLREGLVNVVDRDETGHPYVHVRYGPVGTQFGSWFGPFKDDLEAHDYIANASFERSYAKGHGVWKIGHRVRFLGAHKDAWLGHKDRDKLDHQVFHTGQRMIAPGETAMIVYDHGYDYRYLYRMEKDGLLIRPGGGRFERVFEDYYPPMVGKVIEFTHENGSIVQGVVVGPGMGPYNRSYLSVYVTSDTMIELGLARERRHRSEGMTRQVLRKRIINEG